MKISQSAALGILFLLAFPTVSSADWTYEYYEYETSLSLLPDFDALTAASSGTAAVVEIIRPPARASQYAFRFRNTITVGIEGNYQFATNSDDGSQLLIDDVLVVDNDGLHGARSISNSIFLAAGSYSIEVTMFQQGGGERLEVSYAPPGSAFRSIPADGVLASPDQLDETGAWGPVIEWPFVPVSAANMPDGRVITWASNERYSFPGGRPEFTYTGIWNPANNVVTEIDHPTHDMFCAHQVMLENGQVFVSGGRNSGNSPWTSVFDLNTEQWVPLSNMNRGRWYPTSVALSDGSVFTAIGSGGGNTGEKYDPDTGQWNILNDLNFNTDANNNNEPVILGYPSSQYGERDWWPLFGLMPNGDIFHAGPTPQMHVIDVDGSGDLQQAAAPFTDWYPKHGATVMYDEGKMISAGGWVSGSNIVSTNRSHVIDLNGPSPVVTETNAMIHPRKFQNGVMLPNGEVLIVGGNTSGRKFNDSGTVYAAETWNPTTQEWRELAEMSVPRNYHSIALILTDGTVLSAGGGLCNCAADHANGQIFYPPYLYNSDGSLATRPAILTAPAAIRASDTFDVTTDVDITSFSLIKMSSTTHAVNTDLRYLSVPFTGSNGTYELTAHSNPNVLTPGYWMLFALDANGTPSIAEVIQIRSINAGETPETTINFDFLGFTDSGVFQLNGAASILGGYLRLTPNTPDVAGSAFYRTPVSIDSTTAFATSFTFSSSGTADGAEGFAFVLQGNEASMLGQGASGLGYRFEPNTLVVEFDTESNAAGDVDGNHIAVHLAGDSESPVASASVPFDMEDGDVHRAWVEYSSALDELHVYLSADPLASRPATPTLTASGIDLLSAVGSLAYAGFTGSTGSNSNNHDIHAWSVDFAAGETPLQINPIDGAPQQVDGPVNFTASANGIGLEYRWSFGDGTPQTEFNTSSDISHTYAGPGRYVVTLTVRDVNGVEQTSQFVQSVYPPKTLQQPTSSTTILAENVTGQERIWNVNPDNNTVTVSDADMGIKLAEIPVGEDPRALTLAPDNTIWVANKDSATISIIDVATSTVVGTRSLPQGSRPHGLVAHASSGNVYVTLEQLGIVRKLSVVDAGYWQDASVGSDPRHITVTGDESRLYVSRFISPPFTDEHTTDPKTTVAGGTDPVGGEVIAIDPSTMTAASTIVLEFSTRQPAEITGPGFPNYLGPAIVSPSGDMAWVPSKQDNVLRGLSRNGSPLNHDHTVRAVTSVIDLSTETELAGLRVDHDNSSTARNGVFDPNGIFLFVALEGNREVAVIDVYTFQEMTRFDVGFAPQSVATSADGTKLFVHNFMNRTVSIADITDLVNGLSESVSVRATVLTASNEQLSPQVLRGKQLFYDARDPRLSRESYMSCASCHNDGGHDGRVWDLSSEGEGLRNTISLKGHGGMAHGPLHWSANFDEVQDFENQIRSLALGTGLMSNADFAATQDVLGAPKAGLSSDLDALAAYVASLNEVEPSPYRDADGSLSAEGEAGKVIFESADCGSCHTSPRMTDSVPGVRHDIGTITPASGSRLGTTENPVTALDTPTLFGLWSTAPYLHDGSAKTLEDAVLAHDAVALNGATFSQTEMESLVAYLSQIDQREIAPIPQDWVSQDIGAVGAAGSFSESNGTLTIQASGADVWGVVDEFHYVYQTLEGDGEIVGRVASLTATDPWAKAGLMMRDGLANNAVHAMVVTTGSNGADFQYRPLAGGRTETIGGGDGTSSAPLWLRLVREGDTFTGYKSTDGVNWVLDGQATIQMSSLIYVGLMATSHRDGTLTTAVIDSAVVIPAVPPVPDTTAPSVPQNVLASATGQTSASVSWDASTDSESGIGGYRVYRNGGFVQIVTGTSFADNGLQPGTTYNYTVSAFDGSPQQNESAQSSPVASVTTDPEVFVNVPLVVEQSQAVAEAQIGLAGLTVGTVTTSNSDTVAPGNVISQTPAGNTSALEGSAVDLVVSLGAAPVAVSDVVGLPVTVATAQLNNDGLTVGTVTRTFSTTVPADVVISQNPGSGVLVANGSAVDLVVSDGLPPPDVTPPTTPTGLVASVAGAYQINLSWTASTDTESAIGGYRVYVDGVLAGTTATTSFAATGLNPITSYSFTVVAFDASPAANESSPSDVVTATTDAEALWVSQDIGAVAAAGSFSESNGTLTIRASGADVWGVVDEFHYVYQTLEGDGEIVGRVASLTATDPWAKAGLMMRDGLANNAVHAMVVTTGSNGADFQYRPLAGGRTETIGGGDGTSSAPLWLRLVREGDTFTGYKSTDGVNWVLDGQATIQMSSLIYVGLMATSHRDGTLTTAVIDSAVVIPAVPPVPDTTAPSVPQNVLASATGQTSASVSWDASTDSESGIGGYRVYRNGGFVQIVTGTSFADNGLQPGTTYNYTVSAFDGSPQQNESAQSSPVASVTTDPEVFVNVPLVVEQSQAVAEAQIGLAGLTVGTVTTSNSDTVAPGNVISQTPAGNTSALEGSAVDLVVSLGAAPVAVSDVVGLPVTVATAQLNNDGLTVGTVTRTFSTTVPADVVISQNPGSGVLVANGSAVDLVVSDGLPPPDVTPPTTPTGLVASVAGAYQINLSWTASTDTESAIGGYRVYVDGVLAGTTATTSFAATGLNPITSYSFTVVAFDASPAANESSPSDVVTATTDAEALWVSQDIGAVAAAGSFSESNGTLTIRASGADVWGVVDEFHYVYQTLEGDGEIVGRVASLTATDPWAKAGLMMRDGLANNAVHAMVVTTGSNGADFQYRPLAGGRTETIGGGDGTSSAPLWLRLVREGDTFTGYKSTDGVNWVLDGQATIQMSSLIYVGLMATSHSDGTLTTAVIDNAVVTPAVPPVPDTTAPSVPQNVTVNPASGKFASRLTYDVGEEPHSIAAADLDQDGNVDLITADAPGNSLSVLFGDGSGGFGNRLILAVGVKPKVAIAADLNSDGILDLATADQDSRTVSVHLGLGSRAFSERAPYTVCLKAHDIVAYDLDLDNDLDLVTTCHAGGMSILPGNGDGTFSSSITVAAGGSPHSLAVADYNQDAFPDIAVAAYADDSVNIYYGTGSMVFEPFVSIPVGDGPHSIKTSDFNGDGLPDLATANDTSSDTSVLIGSASSGFNTAVSYSVGLLPKGMTIGDIDNDGIPDLVVGITGGNYPTCCVPGEGDHISVLSGIGDGTFAEAQEIETGRTIFSSAVTDVNNDNINDIVVAEYSDGTVSVILGMPAGSGAIQISWSSSTDGAGSGVRGYRIYRDFGDLPIAEVSAAQLSFIDSSGLLPSTTYNYSVSSFDFAAPENESSKSPSVSLTTAP